MVEGMRENIINYIPLKIYRYMRWLHQEWNVYQKNKKFFSKDYAKICFNADEAQYRKMNLNKILNAYQEKDQYILNYLNTLLYNEIEQSKKQEIGEGANQKKPVIWVFWWQGEENAPDIVKACIKSIRKNANGHEVLVLSQHNYQNYVSLPEIVKKKHDENIIGHAFYSDMIRLALLSEYGGMWIDATVFISQPIPEEIFSLDFFTLKTYDPNNFWFSKSRWTGYFMSGKAGFPFFSFSKELLFQYWKKNDHAIDYLLADYIYGLAYENIPVVREAIDSIPNNNIKRGALMAAINEEYDPVFFRTLEIGETFASKLSWRYGNPVSTTKEGKLTNYGHLLQL